MDIVSRLCGYTEFLQNRLLRFLVTLHPGLDCTVSNYILRRTGGLTCPDTTSSAQLPLQAALKLPRVADPVWVRQIHSVAHAEEDGHECADL